MPEDTPTPEAPHVRVRDLDTDYKRTVPRSELGLGRYEVLDESPYDHLGDLLDVDFGLAAPDAFDPSAKTAAEVLEHLEAADATERERVLAREADGKARKTVLAFEPRTDGAGDGDEDQTPGAGASGDTDTTTKEIS